MKDKTKNKLCGIAGTVLFHLLLFLMLFYFTFPRPEIPDEASGVLVQLGTIDEASGTFQPEMSGQNVADAMEAEILDEAAEESITQDIEESVAVPDKKKEDKQQLSPRKKHNRSLRWIIELKIKWPMLSVKGIPDLIEEHRIGVLEQKEARTEIVLPVLNTALPVTEIMIWAVEV